jgi:hypothetical protein
VFRRGLRENSALDEGLAIKFRFSESPNEKLFIIVSNLQEYTHVPNFYDMVTIPTTIHPPIMINPPIGVIGPSIFLGPMPKDKQ